MNADSEALKSCPFCGGEASGTGHTRYSRALTDITWDDGSPVTEAFFVNCVKCGAQSRSGIVGGYQTQADAIAAWNTRTACETLPAGTHAARDVLDAVGTLALAIAPANLSYKQRMEIAHALHVLVDQAFACATPTNRKGNKK